MKVMVLGGSGMLGSMLVRYLSQEFDVIVPGRRECNAYSATPDTIARLADGCDYVINAVGAIPQRGANDCDMAQVNTLFPARLIESGLAERLIQVSTDCVFSGHQGQYTENDIMDAEDSYGKSKAAAALFPGHHLRCSMVGPETHGASLLGWFLAQPPGASVTGYVNHHWNGITTLHFARICAGIIKKGSLWWLPHIQHIVPADAVSKYDLLCLFRDSFGRPDITVTPGVAQPVDRRLCTVRPERNTALWASAGYQPPPTVQRMIKELAEYMRCGS